MTITLWAKFAFVLQSISQLPSGMVGGADGAGAERATSLPIALPKEGAAMCGESARCPVTFILFLPDLAHLVGKCMPRTLKAASQ